MYNLYNNDYNESKQALFGLSGSERAYSLVKKELSSFTSKNKDFKVSSSNKNGRAYFRLIGKNENGSANVEVELTGGKDKAMSWSVSYSTDIKGRTNDPFSREDKYSKSFKGTLDNSKKTLHEMSKDLYEKLSNALTKVTGDLSGSGRRYASIVKEAEGKEKAIKAYKESGDINSTALTMMSQYVLSAWYDMKTPGGKAIYKLNTHFMRKHIPDADLIQDAIEGLKICIKKYVSKTDNPTFQKRQLVNTIHNLELLSEESKDYENSKEAGLQDLVDKGNSKLYTGKPEKQFKAKYDKKFKQYGVSLRYDSHIKNGEYLGFSATYDKKATGFKNVSILLTIDKKKGKWEFEYALDPLPSLISPETKKPMRESRSSRGSVVGKLTGAEFSNTDTKLDIALSHLLIKLSGK